MELKRICGRGELIALAEEYISACKSESERFPNIAGFARSLSVGVSTLSKIRRRWPEQYYALLALFEDEALNSKLSATVFNAYFKERLNIGENDGGGALKVGEIRAVFEHDMSEDGK